ncbi:MAG TPA: MMPL family transporter [Kineosporiaceae bacterium]|nr:MMPL family transporter [Kineosporiaceae bacterium]
MAVYLHRLGAFAFRRRWLVLIAWLLVVVGIAVASAGLKGTTSGSFSIPGTQSQKAIDLLEERLPAATGAAGRVVFAAEAGQKIDASQQAAIKTAVAAMGKASGVVQATDPFATGLVSADGRIALTSVQWGMPANLLEVAQRDAVVAAANAAKSSGLEVEFGGDAAPPVAPAGGVGEIVGLAIAALVLAITFGSLLAAGMPLLTAIIGVAIGLLGITAATGFVELSSAVPTLALMLGLAVGIDYALFIMSRHRAQLQQGMEPAASAALAVATAGSSVVFAGATVVIALAALVVVRIPFLAAMGIAAASTVAFAVLIAITLVPALLGFAGMRLAKGKNHTHNGELAPTAGSRWGEFLLRHRIVAVVGTVLVLGGIAVPALNMRLALSDDSTAAVDATQRNSYDLLTTGFGAGFNGPLAVVVDAGAGKDVTAAADAVGARLETLADIQTVAKPALNPAGDTAIISVIPASGPSTTQTKELVKTVRAATEVVAQEHGSEALVTGQTAVNIDVSDRLAGALVPYLIVIVGLAFVLLLLAFRSLLVPLTAILGFLLTITASFGATTAVFQEGFAASLLGVNTQAPIISLLPILIIGILFGLAMDYQVFLVSRMGEARSRGASSRLAILSGFRHGARVITAAALIMVAVFSGFILEDDAIVKSIGFTLAFGILVDAFLVRMTLIPALMSLLGDKVWSLPNWLDRVLPHVDIEGATVEALHNPTARPSVAPVGRAHNLGF